MSFVPFSQQLGQEKFRASGGYVKPEDDDGLPYLEHRIQIKQIWKRNRILQIHFTQKKLQIMLEEGGVQTEVQGRDILRIDGAPTDPQMIMITYNAELSRPVLNIYAESPEQRTIILRDLSEFMRQLRA